MEGFTDIVNNEAPGIDESQLRDFSYRERRDKFSDELEGVSKREYANRPELQEELEGIRLDGTSWRDDLEFDNEMIIGDVQPEIQQQAPVPVQPIQQQINQNAYGGHANPSGDRLISFKGGGTHEQNSNGGIPIGMGSNGKMNTVEEGETKYDFDEGGYIFSNRIDTKGLFRDF
jgi:hypothetical protein